MKFDDFGGQGMDEILRKLRSRILPSKATTNIDVNQHSLPGIQNPVEIRWKKRTCPSESVTIIFPENVEDTSHEMLHYMHNNRDQNQGPDHQYPLGPQFFTSDSAQVTNVNREDVQDRKPVVFLGVKKMIAMRYRKCAV